MAYVSLYRKYRPQNFEDVVGQEHVTTTLKNAVAAGRVASGYLFCGTRGTAKTTCARILAKALNCIGPDGLNTKPTPEPCGQCGPCKSIAASNFVDVLEMDAASHGKVDDVRDLVASIKFPPMEGRYKVYIIDEAHQLSRDAMDAFLKTLEEPPDRVVFILATTELEKLPITIASRCQVFEFKRGTIAQISHRLTQVLQEEGVAAEPQATALVARAADGSYRDSLSLLEQVLAYKRENVTAHDVSLVLGTVDDDVLAHTVGLLAASDAAGVFELAGSVVASGKDIRQFLKSLSTRLRDMLYLSVGAPVATADGLDDSATVRRQAALFAPSDLLRALEIISEAERESRFNNQHRLLLEMTLLRLVRLPSSPANVGAEPVARAVTAPIAAPRAAASAAEPAPRPAAPPAEQTPRSTPSIPTAPPLTPAPPVPVASVEVALAPPSPSIESDLLSDDPIDDEPEEMDALLPGDDIADIIPGDEIAAKEDGDTALPSLWTPSIDIPESEEEPEDLLHVQTVAVPEPPPPVPSARPALPPDAHPDLIRLQKAWQEVVNRMGTRSPSGAAHVRDASPIAVREKTIFLQFSGRFHYERMESSEKGRKALEDIINKTLGLEPGTYKIKCTMQGENSAIRSATPGPPKPAPAVVEEAQESPLMDEVIAVFGGRVLDEDGSKGY
jgi:DNA polymerase-3 subunit gamma/tau